MKTKINLLLSILILFASCQQSKQEKAIQDYVEDFNGTKTDLSFKVKSLDKVRDINGKDSVSYLLKEIGDTASLEYLEKMIAVFDSICERYDSIASYYAKQLDEEYGKAIGKKNYELINLFDEGNRRYSEKAHDKKGTYIELCVLKANIKTYQNKGDSILVAEWKCTYTVKNPFLNNVSQQITKTFYLSPDNKVILTSDGKDKTKDEIKK